MLNAELFPGADAYGTCLPAAFEIEKIVGVASTDAILAPSLQPVRDMVRAAAGDPIGVFALARAISDLLCTRGTTRRSDFLYHNPGISAFAHTQDGSLSLPIFRLGALRYRRIDIDTMSTPFGLPSDVPTSFTVNRPWFADSSVVIVPNDRLESLQTYHKFAAMYARPEAKVLFLSYVAL